MVTTRKWPRERPEALEVFYGRHTLGSDRYPTLAWEVANLVWIKPPYPMRASWSPGGPITRIRCHRKVAESLSGILAAILARYGSSKGVRAVRMDLFGGAYAYRPVRGGTRLSLHAYGAAIDLDPVHNPLGMAWKAKSTMLDLGVVEVFEAAGWTWGGRFKGRKDCMHFQAAG